MTLYRTSGRYSPRYTYPVYTDSCQMYSRDKSYFSIAREISTMSDYSKMHLGCVAVLGHRIISSGFNSSKTDPVQKYLNILRFPEDGKKYYPHSSHAEIRCLKPLYDSDIPSSKIKLYIYRETKNGVPALARPCISCMKYIRDIGIYNIYYSGDDEFFKENLKSGDIFLLKKQL